MKPEAISKNHYVPYIVNDKYEPLPLRVGVGGPATDASSVERQDSEECGASSSEH